MFVSEVALNSTVQPLTALNNREDFDAECSQLNTNRKMNDKNLKPENGLVNLVTHYQKMFDREENTPYYNPNDYQKAKRKFVKYSLNKRSM